jgi:hypothetical protein
MNMKKKILNEIENVNFQVLCELLKDNFKHTSNSESEDFLKQLFVEQIEHLFEEIKNQ